MIIIFFLSKISEKREKRRNVQGTRRGDARSIADLQMQLCLYTVHSDELRAKLWTLPAVHSLYPFDRW